MRVTPRLISTGVLVLTSALLPAAGLADGPTTDGGFLGPGFPGPRRSATAPAGHPGVTVKTLRASGTDLSDIIDALRDQTQQNIFVNWKALQEAGIGKDLPVTVDLSDLTLGAAVDKLLQEVGGLRVALDRETDDGVLTISTSDDFATNVETRVYDVQKSLGKDPAVRSEQVTAIVRRVRGIDPLSWRANGGKVGNVQELSGQLIVTHTPAIQRRVAAELGLPYIEPQPATAPATRPADPTAPTARAAAEAGLAMRLPEVRFDAVSLGDVMDFIHDTTHVTVVAQWDTLAKTGITRDSPVTIRVRNATLEKTISTVLTGLGDADATQATGPAMTSLLDDGQLLVTTRADLIAHYMTDARYDISDLLKPDPIARKSAKADLRDLVLETVTPDLWSHAETEPGGRATWDGDTLVVRQTADGQARVARLLAQLRDQRR